mmetsp:Transcript_14075/g.33457  ORF Transcript_14075/g.33457 Transcript_14075/m.33457 type:complete len:224 (+) Transcript_14075:407-1078(+)
MYAANKRIQDQVTIGGKPGLIVIVACKAILRWQKIPNALQQDRAFGVEVQKDSCKCPPVMCPLGQQPINKSVRPNLLRTKQTGLLYRFEHNVRASAADEKGCISNLHVRMASGANRCRCPRHVANVINSHFEDRAEIDQFQVAVAHEHEIVFGDISMHQPVAMHEINRTCHVRQHGSDHELDGIPTQGLGQNASQGPHTKLHVISKKPVILHVLCNHLDDVGM